MWIERFLRADDPGVSATLDDLAARAVAVPAACGAGAPSCSSATAPPGRVQDLGQRLLDVRAETEGPCADALLDTVDACWRRAGPRRGLPQLRRAARDVDVPGPDTVFDGTLWTVCRWAPPPSSAASPRSRR
ncbi:MAG: hypothetical protein R3F59_20040 [Myxococcota bacterium]